MSSDPPSATKEARGQLLRQLRRRAAALARDVWGRGPERCEVHWAGADLLVIVFHGGLTAAEANLKGAGELGEVARSRANFRHAIEPRLHDLVVELTGRTVVAAVGASRLDPDLTIETIVLTPVEAQSVREPLASRARAAERKSEIARADAASGVDSAYAVQGQAAQARRKAAEVRRESRERREPPDPADA